MIRDNFIDLEKDQMDLLKEILGRHVPDKEVWAYGSRVTWKASERSDLDLVIFECGPYQFGDLQEALEESNLLVSVNVMEWESLPEDFKENIKRKYVVVQEGRNLIGWQERKLEDVAEVGARGGTPSTKVSEYWDGDVPWLTPKDLSNFPGRYVSRGERSISELGLSKSSAKLLPKGSVLLTIRAPVGYLAIAEGEISINDGFRSLIPHKGTDNLFLYYLLKKNIEYLKSQSEGTTFVQLSGSTLKSLSFNFPPLAEQKAIAEVLSGLDDKIDLLYRQNKTLEDMAQALFRKWFVEDAEDGWEIKKIGEFLETRLGGTPSKNKSEYWDGNIPWINSGETNKFRIFKPTKYITRLGLEKSSTKLLPKGTTVIAITGATLGQVSLLEIDSCANQSVVGIIPNEKLPREYLYLWMKNEIKYLVLNQTGGAQQHINKNDIENSLIRVPPLLKLTEKTPILRHCFDKISDNILQICTVEKLRDILLPKLISGSIRINSGLPLRGLKST